MPPEPEPPLIDVRGVARAEWRGWPAPPVVGEVAGDTPSANLTCGRPSVRRDGRREEGEV